MCPSSILPNTWVLLRLPNQTTKLVKILPNSTINLGKFGSFPTNALIHRPYYLTFDILDTPGPGPGSASRLCVVPTEEITRDLLGQELEQAEAEAEADGELGRVQVSEEDIVVHTGSEGVGGGGLISKDQSINLAPVGPGDDSGLDDERNNRDTVDDPSAQRLTWAEIEELKRKGGGSSGREIVNALMTFHANIHQKTAYSLSKYALRKRSKFLKRFTVLPIDVFSLLDHLMNEKEPAKVMEMQQEGLGLMLALGNVRHCPNVVVDSKVRRGGRWLVVDETGGLLVAAVAERLGLLEYEQKYLQSEQGGTEGVSASDTESDGGVDVTTTVDDGPPSKKLKLFHNAAPTSILPRPISQALSHPTPATANTITIIHPNEQPNISLLKYFNYDPNTPPISHPLYTHLHMVSYLALLSPSSDPTLEPPERVSESTYKSWRSGKKSAYLRKWRRWERAARAVMEARAGEFDGLLVASWMEVKSLLGYLAPLVRGSGQIVVWRPEREGLVSVVDACGKEMKGSWLRRKDAGEIPEPQLPQAPKWEEAFLPYLSNAWTSGLPPSTMIYLIPDDPVKAHSQPDITQLLALSALPDLISLSERPPAQSTSAPPPPSKKELDPTILLAPTIHSTTVRKYQVLPGRTHPVMTSKGGAEGYVLVATRVVPVEGKVDAMGRGGMRRKARLAAREQRENREKQERKRELEREEESKSKGRGEEDQAEIKVEMLETETEGLASAATSIVKFSSNIKID